MFCKLKQSFVFLVALLALPAQGVELESLQLVGLFKNTAVLQHQGKQRLIKVGKTSQEGIKLMAVTATTATILIDGEQHQLSLSRAVSRYVKQEKQNHIIAINGNGQYFTAGSINGQPVRFLVDTGATSVALNTAQARSLGIDFASGRVQQASTAGGIVKSYSLNLERVKVGGIELTNIRAAVLEGVYPEYALLGMTYLRHVEISENDGIMKLTKKY